MLNVQYTFNLHLYIDLGCQFWLSSHVCHYKLCALAYELVHIEFNTIKVKNVNMMEYCRSVEFGSQVLISFSAWYCTFEQDTAIF